MMDFDGAIRTSGLANYRNWRTADEPRRRKYDQYYFLALTYSVQTLDDLADRAALFLEREARMKEGY